MRKESDILYQIGDFWICTDKRGDFEVYQCGAVASTRVGIFGRGLPDAFTRAKAFADKRHRESTGR